MTQLQRTLETVRTNPWVMGLRLVVLVGCMLAAGFFSVVLLNFQRLAPSWMLDADVVAYLRTDVSAAQQERLAGEMRQWPEVELVREVSREAARKRMEAQLGDWKGVLDGLPENPLPASLEITLKPKAKQSADLEAVVDKVRRSPEIQEVFYGKTWTDKLEFAVNFVRTWGWGALGFLALAAVLILAQTVGLAAASHREELEIYRIVGATPFFVKFPFYAKGMIEGGVSALLAACLLICFLLASRMFFPLPLSAALSIQPGEMVLVAGGLTICGTATGWIGARIGLRNMQPL